MIVTILKDRRALFQAGGVPIRGSLIAGGPFETGIEKDKDRTTRSFDLALDSKTLS